MMLYMHKEKVTKRFFKYYRQCVMTIMKNIKLKKQPWGFVSSMEKLQTPILLEVRSCIMERFHKTSQALQDSKMTLN